MTPVARCEVVREIRTILVRHYLDLGRLNYSLMGHTVNLSGRLDRIPGAESPLSPMIVEAIIRDLRNIRHVTAVFAEFENWRQNDATGGWVEIQRGIGTNVDAGQNVLTLRDKKGSGGTV